MNYQQKWLDDLNQGELGEKVIVSFLQKKGNLKFIKYNKNMDYDILMEKPDGGSLTFEVKTDRYEKYNGKTGNIFVETRCNGKNSGIWGSYADIYVFYFPDFGEIYMIKTEELKRLIQEENHIFRYSTQSGDMGKVSGFLINRYTHKDKFKFYQIPVLDCWN